MATKTHVIVFGHICEHWAKPEMFTCAASEAKEIEELLTAVACEGWPIVPLSDRYFVEAVPSITLEELYERFAEAFEEPEIEPSKEAAEKAAGGRGGGEEKEA